MEDRKTSYAKQRHNDVLTKYGSLEEYNELHQEIAIPYEIVILPDVPNGYIDYHRELSTLIENGCKSGTYFVIIAQEDCLGNPEISSLINLSHAQQLDCSSDNNCGNGDLVSKSNISNYKELTNAAFNYLNSGCVIKQRNYEDVQLLKEKCDFLSKEMADVKEMNIHHEQTINELTQDKENLLEVKRQLENLLKQKEQEIARLKRDISDLQETESRLRSEKSSLEHAQSKLTAELASAKSEVMKFEDERREEELLRAERAETERKKDQRVTVYFHYYCGDYSGSETWFDNSLDMEKEEYYSLLQAGPEYLANYVKNTFDKRHFDYVRDVSMRI